MLSYRIEFSRPGKPPFAVAHHRRGGRYAPDEIVPLGGTLEILAGNLCGSGELTLSRIPERNGYRLSPLDRVQVFFDDDPDPIYLGEVICDPRPDVNGKVNLKLQGLWERVKLAAWACDTAIDGTVQPFKAKFRDYLLGVLERAKADLPPGVTVGEIPEVDATLRAVTLHEALGDTVQTALPVTQGGAAGVNAKGQFTIVLPDDQRRHRFIRTQSQRPPGEIGEYRNAIRFAYKKPDGTDAYFVYRYQLDITEHGASWLDDNLPSSVTTTLNNPYADEQTPLAVELTHPSGLKETRTASTLMTNPATAVTLGQIIDLGTDVLAGKSMPLRISGQEEVVLTSTQAVAGSNVPATLPLMDLRFDSPLTNLAIVLDYRDGTQQTQIFDTNANGKNAGFNRPDNVWRLHIKYLEADVRQYRLDHTQDLMGFNLTFASVAQPSGLTVTGYFASAHNPNLFSIYTGPIQLNLEDRTYNNLPVVVPSFDTPIQTRLGFNWVRQWRANDLVTTDSNITSVEATDLTDSQPRKITLIQADDDVDTGRKRWKVPEDTRLSDLILTGNLSSMGWVGISLTDETGLTAYAIGKLRDLVNPVLSWTGKYNNLRRLDVRGTVGFDDEQGEVDLQVVRGVYDLTTLRCTIEAGTKQALNDAQAIGQAFEGIERIQRLQQRPGDTV